MTTSVRVVADRCPSEDVFADWMDARLDAASLEALDQHLDGCTTCRELYAELSRLDASNAPTGDHDRSVETRSERPVAKAPRAPTNGPAAIGRFLVERMLGEGGMGTVFEARDPDLDRRVAVKVLKAGGDDARLVEEARSQAQLSHPNVVRVYEVGHGGGGLYIAMELIEGETLRDWLRRRPPWIEVVGAFDAAGRGLAAAHRAGLVHRDFKPANVLVGSDGRIAVTDFGLARSHGGPRRRARRPTESGMVAGTPAYFAPEQCRGERATEHSDQFAFAISFYEGLYGTRPFDGDDAETIMENILAAQVREPPADTEVPAWLHEVVLRGLSPEPTARFPTLDAMLLAIDERLARRSQRHDCPFPGLAAFDVSDGDVFFGRDPEIAEAARRIADTGFLAVVGPSGSGKSSFVRAGLIPALRRQSRVVELFIRPGPQPRATLRKLLRDIAPDLDTTDLEPSLVARVLADHATQHQSRVVLVVDQFEELFTLGHEPIEQQLFVDTLEAIAEQVSDRVRCVVTLRSDLLDRVQSHKAFLRRIVASLLFLTNPDRDTLRDALVRPLAYVGYELESREIAEHIAADLEGKPGALPLLQFTARQLWSQADHERRLITMASYRELGEVAGLLADHASSVMTALGPADRPLAREIFIRLVTPDRTRAVVSIGDLGGLGGAPSDTSRVIEALVGARLVVVHDGEPSNTVELVHESLIDRWPALKRWLDELDQGDAMFAEVSTAARRWAARDRPPGLLWQGETARRLEHFRQHHRGTLTADEAAFVTAALDGDRRQRRRRRAILIGAFATLTAAVLGAVVAIVLIQNAAVEARASEAKATDQEHAAKLETERAQSAERQLAEQVEALEKEKVAREGAEGRVSSTTKKLDKTYEQLEQALADAKRETEHALAASDEARKAAAREREQRSKTEAALAENQKLLAEKQKELERALAEQRKINTTRLKGVPDPASTPPPATP